MAKFESSIKQIPYRQQAVYDKLSNPGNLSQLTDRLTEEQKKNISFTEDSITVNQPPVGEITLHIINREEPKCIKFETTQSPLPFYLWIQMLPVTETTSKMKLTIEAQLNPLLKGMVSKPLKEQLEKIADALAMIKYE